MSIERTFTEPRTLGVVAHVRGSDFMYNTQNEKTMKTKFNSLMFSRFHLEEMRHTPSKKRCAIIYGVLDHFYYDKEPDFRDFTDGDKLMKMYTKMVTFIEEGIHRAEAKIAG